MRKSKGIGGGEVAIMEFGSSADMVVGVRTRAQVRVLAMAASTPAKNKRKVYNSSEVCLSTSIRGQTRRRLMLTPETSKNSGQNIGESSPLSRYSSNGSSELVNETLVMRSGGDLESEGLQNESSTYLNCRKRREVTPSSSFREESDDSEPMERRLPSVSRSRSTEHKILPSQIEIEEFFSIAEKDEQRRFAEKYNYDIVKDVPLKGRYEWIPLTP